MINGLTLRNFRAFKEQSFSFAKLNIFIGKNNSGKSSALSAINVIAQTIKQQDLDGTPLILNGPYDKLGTFIDVVHGNNPRRRIGIDIDFDNFLLRTEYKYRTQRRQIELASFELTGGGKPITKFVQRKDAYAIQIGGDAYEKLFPDAPKRRPRFRNFWPVRLAALRPTLSRPDERSTPQYIQARRAENSLMTARMILEDHLNNFDSLSPFRDQPQRTYLYSGETARQIGTSGSNTAAMLAADSAKRGSQRKNLVDGISQWFEYTGIAQGLSVVSLTPRHFELCLVSNDGTQHNICDVGFGCSQVLPVLTAGLNLFHNDSPSRERTLIVQEPEIHLHPNAQAAMGSFFVSLVREPGQVFIETHSDNLVLRVARHVALGDIDPTDVAIFFVSDVGENRVTRISLTETGAFKPEFPEGFFPQRQAESLLLARAAMHRRSGEQQRQMTFLYPETKP